MSLRLTFVASPLIARSGVYNSATEIVSAARAQGLPWQALIGVSSRAGGSVSATEGVYEFHAEPSGISGVRDLKSYLSAHAVVQEADLVVSLVPQSDMALATIEIPWVAYLRGLPWPAPRETSQAKSAIWHAIELAALRRATEVWATTPILAKELGKRVDRIVPPGVVPPSPPATTAEERSDIVWAARYSLDKNPRLLLDAMREVDATAVMYGSGPLEPELRQSVPPNVKVGGWRDKSHVWDTARIYVGTSTREAFGRSAVEAALLGIPVVISDQFGCAPMLFGDPAFSERFVLPIGNLRPWVDALRALSTEDQLRASVGEHIKRRAKLLTITSAVSNVLEAATLAIESRANSVKSRRDASSRDW